MVVTVAVHAYKGADDTAFREPLRHHYNASWLEGANTVRLAYCNGPLMLQMHEADADAESYVLSCGSCARRVKEIDGYSIQVFMEKHSIDVLNDAQMIVSCSMRPCPSGRRKDGACVGHGYTGYLTPDYLRWCGVAGEVLERVKKYGPQYCWKVEERK